MALQGEAKKAYQRELMRKRRAEKAGLKTVTVEPLPMDKELKVSMVWDEDRHPNKKAFEIAVQRVARAQRYAQMFPHLIRGDDEKYQDVDWQYEHEGIPSTIRSKDHTLPQ